MANETRERVLSVIEELDFRPDAAAHCMHIGQSRLVSFFTGEVVQNVFIYDPIIGAQPAGGEHKKLLFVLNTGNDKPVRAHMMRDRSLFPCHRCPYRDTTGVQYLRACYLSSGLDNIIFSYVGVDIGEPTGADINVLWNFCNDEYISLVALVSDVLNSRSPGDWSHDGTRLLLYAVSKDLRQ